MFIDLSPFSVAAVEHARNSLTGEPQGGQTLTLAPARRGRPSSVGGRRLKVSPAQGEMQQPLHVGIQAETAAAMAFTTESNGAHDQDGEPSARVRNTSFARKAGCGRAQ